MVCIYYENKEIQSVNEPRTFQPLEIKPSLYESGQWFKDSSSTGQAMDIINQAENASKLKFNPVNYENELTIASKKLTHDAFYIGGIKGTTDAQQNLQFTIYNNDTFNFATQMALNLLSNGILKQNNINEQISITLQPFDNAEEAKFSENDDNKVINIAGEQLKMYMEQMLIVAIAITTSISVSIYGPFTVKEREDGITHQLFLNGTKRINYWIGVLISDGICLIVPLLLIGVVGIFSNLDIYQPRVITYTATVTFICGISSLLHQYVVCYFFKKYEKVSSLFIIINPVLSLCMGVYALIISIISSIVNTNEEESNKNKKGGFGEYFFYLLLFLYAPSMIVFLYIKLSSFIFQHKIKITQEEIAQFVLRKDVKDIYAKSISESEKSKLITNLFFKDKIPTISEIFKSKEDKFLVLLIVAVVFLVIYAVLLYLLERSKARIVKKNSEYTEEERKLKNKMLENGPRDVYNEWWRVKQALNNGSKFANRIALKVFQLNKDFSLKASDVKKLNNNNNNKKKNDNDKNGKANLNEKDQNENEKNGKKSAFQKMDNRIIYDKNKKKNINRIVDDVTFGVDVGECLGLLGPNGAGKTTSISMITGLLSHTHGTVVYGDKDISQTDMPDLSLGYCSQHDSLWKLLTVKETIQFYLNICGYPRKDIPRYTKALAEACGIEIHLNKKVSEISGGTKRKLSLIVAICSSPNYLILDEPSAGMDPFTRRYMWKLISELKKVRETATILTTHSTEEAEALCDRIAILIKGRLVCVDSPKSIKMNHSHSYILEVFTDRPEEFEEVYVRGQNIFGLASNENYQLESSISYQKYSVQMKTENIANVFSVMEQAKKAGIISQYNFGQYSLEQVFINFVNNVE
jgi:ABC-type multidrug transport system ATPase subunit